MGTSTLAQGDTYVNQVSTSAGGSNGQIQYNNNGALGGYTAPQAQGVIFPQSAWASLPAASTAAGMIYNVTNVAISNRLMQSNGTLWLPLNGHMLLDQSGVPVALTGSTARTTLSNTTVKGGLLGTGGIIAITFSGSCSTGANTKIFNLNFGSSQNAFSLSQTTATNQQAKFYLRANNSTSALSCFNNTSLASPYGATSTSVNTLAVNTTIDNVLSITGTLASGSDTITLLSYTIEVFLP